MLVCSPRAELNIIGMYWGSWLFSWARLLRPCANLLHLCLFVWLIGKRSRMQAPGGASNPGLVNVLCQLLSRSSSCLAFQVSKSGWNLVFWKEGLFFLCWRLNWEGYLGCTASPGEKPLDVVGVATVVNQFFLPLFVESSTISYWRAFRLLEGVAGLLKIHQRRACRELKPPKIRSRKSYDS